MAADAPALVALVSDVHYGVRYTARATRGLGAYDPAEARARLRRYADWLVRRAQQYAFGQALVVLLGDLTHGPARRRDELALPPAQQALELARELAELAWRVRVEGAVELAVHAVAGNHDADGLVLELLAERLVGLAPLTRHAGGGWLEAAGHWLYAAHGDAVRHPRELPRYAEAIAHSYGRVPHAVLLGHLHQPRLQGSTWGGQLVVNGSVCGPAPYAVRRGLPADRPCQLALVVEPALGLTDCYRCLLTPAPPCAAGSGAVG